MKLIEWLFPVRRYQRLGRKAGLALPLLVLAASTITYWFALHVFLYTGTTAHISQPEKALSGLREAIDVLWEIPHAPLYSLGTEENILRMIFMGGMFFTLAMGGVFGWFAVPQRVRETPGTARHLAGIALLGSAKWSIGWIVLAVLSVLFDEPGVLISLGAPCLLATGIMVLIARECSRSFRPS